MVFIDEIIVLSREIKLSTRRGIFCEFYRKPSLVLALKTPTSQISLSNRGHEACSVADRSSSEVGELVVWNSGACLDFRHATSHWALDVIPAAEMVQNEGAGILLTLLTRLGPRAAFQRRPGQVHIEYLTTIMQLGFLISSIMKTTTLSLLAFLACAIAAPDASTEALKPKGKAPHGCDTSFDGTFEVSIFRPSTADKRDVIQKRGCNADGTLVITLEDGVLTDAKGRTGSIVSNYQFQFDGPPQPDALFTGGFAACTNQSLALGSSTIFYQCRSGDFYNLYDRNWAEQCSPVEIIMIPCGTGKALKVNAPKRRVVGSSIVATTVVTVVSGGVTHVMPTTIAVPMCQIGDGQVQVRTTPCDNIKLPIITAPPVSQISDGQLQVPSAPAAPPAAASGSEALPPAQGASATVTEEAPAQTTNGAPAQETASETGISPPDITSEAPAQGTGSALENVASTGSSADTATESEAVETRPSIMKFDTSLPTSTGGGGGSQDTAPAATAAPTSGSMRITPALIVAMFIGAIGSRLFV
ncbi:hypothetical protein G7046_g592 [Stylonectria norvegica]|nr:hypothetical protein G7046_g592 [Stylonectria norvegica]